MTTKHCMVNATKCSFSSFTFGENENISLYLPGVYTDVVYLMQCRFQVEIIGKLLSRFLLVSLDEARGRVLHRDWQSLGWEVPDLSPTWETWETWPAYNTTQRGHLSSLLSLNFLLGVFLFLSDFSPAHFFTIVTDWLYWTWFCFTTKVS